MDDDQQTVTFDKPTRNYARLSYWTLNAILLVLVPILCILGWNALKEVRAEREDRVRAEFCAEWEATSDIPLESCR